MTEPSDTQLKLFLAKMLPGVIQVDNNKSFIRFFWTEKQPDCYNGVKDTEWLHICQLVELDLIELQNQALRDTASKYYGVWTRYVSNMKSMTFYGESIRATWQLKAKMLTKAVGVEL
jgi:hypothetical protein